MLKNGLKTAHNKSLKTRYKHLTAEEKRIVKAHENLNRINRELYGYRGFYYLAPKTENGGVDWDSCSDWQLKLFDLLNEQKEKNEKLLSKHDDNKIEKILLFHRNMQFSYSQSFV